MISIRKQRVEHGMSKHPLYTRWQDMVRRCYSPKDTRYPWYGAKGVTVCNEWKNDPVAFIEWGLANGWSPGMDLDKDTKIPGNTVYSPNTCKFVSHRDNMIAVVGRKSGRSTCKLKLSEQQVAEIIERKDRGELSRLLAIEFSVDHATINRLYRLRA